MPACIPELASSDSSASREDLKHTLCAETAVRGASVQLPAGMACLRACRYLDIVTYKTAFYSFYLPVACGMHLAGVATDSALDVSNKILVKMGQYFQIQDDYLDCFADADVLGKIGTDIQDNKCSWLVCTALQSASPTQRATIAENYGKDDSACIGKIKAVYQCAPDPLRARLPPAGRCLQVRGAVFCSSRTASNWEVVICRELKLAQKFQELEESSYAELRDMISGQSEVPQAVFELFLAKIHKRAK